MSATLLSTSARSNRSRPKYRPRSTVDTERKSEQAAYKSGWEAREADLLARLSPEEYAELRRVMEELLATE